MQLTPTERGELRRYLILDNSSTHKTDLGRQKWRASFFVGSDKKGDEPVAPSQHRRVMEAVMSKFVVAAAIPLLAGCLWAQSQQTTAPTTQTTSWKGMLIETIGDSTSYPVTVSFVLITEDGRRIPFDEDSNEKISALLKVKTNWSKNIEKIMPTRVTLIGTEKGGIISVEDIDFK